MNPEVDCGAMSRFLSLLQPGACTAGLGAWDSLSRFLVSPARRRFMGITHPASERLGADMFLPSGPGPSPVQNGGCVKWIPRPFLSAAEFNSDLRLVEDSGDTTQLSARMARFMDVFPKLGARRKGGGRRRSIRGSVSWWARGRCKFV